MNDRHRQMADLALDAINEVQIHVDAESVREEQLADLWNRWKCLAPPDSASMDPNPMLDKEGKPIEAGWYLDTMEDDPHPVHVFEVGKQQWVYEPTARETEILSRDWSVRMLRITTPFSVL